MEDDESTLPIVTLEDRVSALETAGLSVEQRLSERLAALECEVLAHRCIIGFALKHLQLHGAILSESDEPTIIRTLARGVRGSFLPEEVKTAALKVISDAEREWGHLVQLKKDGGGGRPV
jgi:hypothetical protein